MNFLQDLLYEYWCGSGLLQPGRAHSIRAQGGEEQKLKSDDIAQKLKVHVLVRGEMKEGTVVSFSLCFLAVLPWPAPGLAPKMVPGNRGNTTGCPPCTAPGVTPERNVNFCGLVWTVALGCFISLAPEWRDVFLWVLVLLGSTLSIGPVSSAGVQRLSMQSSTVSLETFVVTYGELEFSVVVLWETRVSTEVSSAVHKQMGSCPI